MASNCFANEKVTVLIDGESYSCDIPNDYDGVVKLLKYVAELERNADTQAFEVSAKYEDLTSVYENKLSNLYDKIESLQLELDNAMKDADKVEKDIKDLTKINNRFMVGLNIGPVFSFDSTFITGVNAGIILDYRILRNVHIGGNILITSFNDTRRPFEVGFGLIVGYSIY